MISDVNLGDTLDAKGRTRFHPLGPTHHLMRLYPDWFYKYDSNQAKSVCIMTACSLIEYFDK